jgi:hypothetical protein
LLTLVGCPTTQAIGDATIEQWVKKDYASVPSSYVTPNANGTQNGRVAVAYRALGPLQRVATLTVPRDLTGAPVDPATVLLPEHTSYVVIDYGPGQSFETRLRTGEAVAPPQGASFNTRAKGVASVAFDEGVVVGAELSGFTTPERPLSRVPSSKPLASAIMGELFLTADLTAPITTAEEGVTESAWGLHASLKRRTGPSSWQELWYFTTGGPERIGCAAIDPTGQVAFATRDGYLKVIGPEGTRDGRASGKVDRKIAHAPYFVSAVDGNWVLVEPRRPPAEVPQLTGLETFAELVARATAAQEERNLVYMLYVNPRGSALQWKSGIVAVDSRGDDVWEVEVPFRVLSPALAGGRGTVVVVGEGVAALEGSKVLWSRPSAVPMQATAFSDGILAVTAGRDLWLIESDGRDRLHLRTRDEPITTAPAIAADGSVWVATREALYVARPKAGAEPAVPAATTGVQPAAASSAPPAAASSAPPAAASSAPPAAASSAPPAAASSTPPP